MKQKCSFILKASISVILALLMLFGTVATSVAKDVDIAETGWSLKDSSSVQVMFEKDTADTAGTINGSAVKDNTYYINLTHDGTGQHWYGDFYAKVNTTGTNKWGYQVKFVDGSTYFSKAGEHFNDDNTTTYPLVSVNAAVAYFQLQPRSSGYSHVWVDITGQENNSYIELKLNSENVNALNYSSLTAGSNNLVPGGTTTLTPTVSGGSNDYKHTYTVTNQSTNATVTGAMSGNTFTAPSVTTSTVFRITDTVTDNKCPGLAAKSKYVDITVAPKQNYYVWGGSKQELTGTQYNTTLTYNAATGLYDGTYTFTSEDWHSILMSKASNSSSFDREWTAYNQVKWAHDTYNNNTVYGGDAYLKKEDLAADDVLKWIEITENSSSWGIKLAARAEGTTVRLSYDATNKILHIWGGTGSDKAIIYAKDGCINIRNDAQQGTTRVIGTTAVTSSTNVTDVARRSLGGEECYTYAKAKKGEEITVTTTVNATYASKYVVKGWDVNGTTYGLDPTAVGTAYSATFTVPDADKVEITPIYWLKNGDVTTFFVNNFNQVPSGWGSALYYYYWGGSQVNVGTEEVYPGQPFVHEGGQYYAQVPKDVTGVTLNNAVWDTIHGQNIMGVGDQQSANHWQTYDYDNFAKIAKEKSNLNSVYFSFKYESKKDNLGSATAPNSSITVSDYNDTSGNGWEEYKNPLGEDINIFGEKLTNPGTGMLYVVSNGYARNYQGDYATEWSIYSATNSSAATASFVGTLPGSALILDSASDFATYGDSGYGPDITDYQTVWTTLKNTYSNYKVKITYEKGMYGGNTLINTSTKTKSGGTDNANRIDGKWDFILNSSYSTANIIIQKSTDNGSTYSEDAFVSNTNQGTTTQATAFFNNTGTTYADKHVVTTDNHVVVSTTNKYKLKTVPQPSTGYQFVGWYRLDEGAKEPVFIGKSTEAESLMSSKATFIARYNYVTEGNLVINHNINGEGTATNHTVKVEIFANNANPDDDDPITSFTGESVPLGSTYISSNSTYKIRVTLTAIADANTSYIANSSATPTVTCSQAAATYYNNPVYTRTGRFDSSLYPQNVVTKVDTFTIASLYGGDTKQDFTVLNYTTTFNKLPTYTIYYKYHGRNMTDSNYLTFARTITLSADEAEGKDSTGANYSGNNGTALRPTYITEGTELVNDITANAPNQNDLQTEVFNKDIAWYVPDSVGASPLTVTASESEPTYTLTYSYVNESGTLVPGQEVEAAYDTRIDLGTKIGNTITHATAATNKSGQKFAYWALGNASGVPLTSTREYKMRLVNDVTIYPVYGNPANGWNSAIDKITRTHQTSDTSDSIFTDFALRFSGFDENGSFIHINPDFKTKYKVGVAVVYDTEGNNTTETTAQLPDGSNPFFSLTKYTDAQNVIQTLVNRNLSTAKLSQINATTYVSKYDADNNKLTNFNRIDYALKYNYNTYYKRSYDAYAYIIDTDDTSGGTNANGTVIAVSPVKSGYIFDGKLPSGAGN